MVDSDLSAADLAQMLGALDTEAQLVQKHLSLMALLDWIRGDSASVPSCVARVVLLLDVLQSRPDLQARLNLWWQRLVLALDGSTLLADYGFASRNALLRELIERLHLKFLPMSPETRDASELFALTLSHAVDAQWIAALPDAALQRLADLLSAPAHCALYQGRVPGCISGIGLVRQVGFLPVWNSSKQTAPSRSRMKRSREFMFFMVYRSCNDQSKKTQKAFGRFH